jgi:hypothetical protein
MMSDKNAPALLQQGEDSSELRPAHGVMEGKGVYNRHAKTQAAGAALATPFLENAIEKIDVGLKDHPIVIADYGCSQGKNSLAQLRIAIRNLRKRIGPSRPIVVSHIDQPSNDFNTLFDVVNSDPDRYVLHEANVFPCAIGRSFYEQVLPAASVNLGWSSYAAQWLRRIPSSIPRHFWPPRSIGAARRRFAREAAEDWAAFLSVRALEMTPGARLVLVLPALADDASSGLGELMDHANAVLSEMVEESAISPREREQMVLGSYLRQTSELLAPFAHNGQFQHLTVEHCQLFGLSDPAWSDYQQTGDKEGLARKRALFFRSTFVPSLASALTHASDSDGETLRRFADRLEDGLVRRLASHPAPIDSLVQTMVLAKVDKPSNENHACAPSS